MTAKKIATADKKRQQLIELGAEVLADTLLELSHSDRIIKDVINRLTAIGDEKIKLFKTKLSQIKRRTSFVSWGDGRDFADELDGLLSLLDDVKNPETGLEWIAKFLESDESIFERADDSNGEIGYVFTETAADLFVAFANRCVNKQKVIDYVIQLNQHNDYGVRDFIFKRASEYLDETMLRLLIDEIWLQHEKVDINEQHFVFVKRGWCSGVRRIAKQLNDAYLFEQATLAYYRDEAISISGCTEIAEVYLQCGEPQKALSWMNQIEKNEHFWVEKRNLLLLNIYGELGDTESQTKIAWDIFKSNRTKETFTQLLNIIGYDEQHKILENEVRVILETTELSYINANFLLTEGYLDELEMYFFQRLDQINGQYGYEKVQFFTQHLEVAEKFLLSSLLHRILLDSILSRANSKYYGQGVKYLKKLNQLAPFVQDWKQYLSHEDYFQLLQNKHGRKTAFWSKY